MGRTLLLTHADCDGICAGALALCAFPGSDMFFTKPVSILDDIRENGHKDYNRIVICDIALTKRDANDIIRELKEIKSKGAELLYFDHHPLPNGIGKGKLSFIDTVVHSKKACASELVYRHFKNQLPMERQWIAIYGAIGDYMDSTPFIKEGLLNWDRRTIYFEVSTLVMGIKNDEFGHYDSKRLIAQTLAKGKNPSDIPGMAQAAKDAVNRELRLYQFVKKNAKAVGKVAYLESIPSFGFRGPTALFAATTKNKPVGVCIYKREDHFDVTIRTRDTSLKLGKIAEHAAETVKGSGGGLEGAAGARIPKNSLQAFLRELNKII